jgi:hypothetical protein
MLRRVHATVVVVKIFRKYVERIKVSSKSDMNNVRALSMKTDIPF